MLSKTYTRGTPKSVRVKELVQYAAKITVWKEYRPLCVHHQEHPDTCSSLSGKDGTRFLLKPLLIRAESGHSFCQCLAAAFQHSQPRQPPRFPAGQHISPIIVHTLISTSVHPRVKCWAACQLCLCLPSHKGKLKHGTGYGRTPRNLVVLRACLQCAYFGPNKKAEHTLM